MKLSIYLVCGLALVAALVFGAYTQTVIPANALPDKSLTPGQFDPRLTVDDICQFGFSKRIRPSREASEYLKRQVFKRYHIDWSRHGEFELDHLVPLDLGGSNELTNLWPEPWTGRWNAHIKDALEVKLAKLVCAGKVPLAQAQREIALDWVSAYHQYFGH